MYLTTTADINALACMHTRIHCTVGDKQHCSDDNGDAGTVRDLECRESGSIRGQVARGSM